MRQRLHKLFEMMAKARRMRTAVLFLVDFGAGLVGFGASLVHFGAGLDDNVAGLVDSGAGLVDFGADLVELGAGMVAYLAGMVDSRAGRAIRLNVFLKVRLLMVWLLLMMIRLDVFLKAPARGGGDGCLNLDALIFNKIRC